MKQFFLLVAADEDKRRLSLPSAYHLAVYRLKNGRWALNPHTRNRKAMQCGDEVVIYASGKREHGMSFVGRARISSSPSPIRPTDRRTVDSPTQMTSTCVDVIALDDVTLFETPVPIKSVFRRFDWVRKPDSPRWAAGLMGGSMRISKHDFDIVTRAASSLSPKEPKKPLSK